jgi:uncharacterized repeat protein (TIGR02543 family)
LASTLHYRTGMKTKRPLPKRFSGTKRVSGILLGLLALALVFASAVSAAPFAFVSKNSSGTLSVIDGAGVADCLASQSPPCAIPVGEAPSGVAVHPAGTRAYVANKDSGTVSVINVETRSPVGNPITVGQEPWAVAVSTDGRRVYVALGNGGVAVINVDTNGDFTGLSSTIQGVGAVLNGIAVASGRVYVTDSSGGRVAVSDGTSVIGTISLGLNSAPNGIAASPSGDRIYVVHLFEDENGEFHLAVAAIDTASNAVVEVTTIEPTTMASPGGIAVSPDGTQLYVANDARGRLHISNIQTQTLSDVDLGASTVPVGVATTPLGTHVFVGGLGRNVSVIGTTAAVCGAQTAPCLIRTVPLGSATFVAGAFATDGPQFTLTTSSSPSAGGSIAANPVGGTYAPGTVVTLTATPAAGYQFSNWSGDCSGSTNPCSVTMNATRSVTANFTPLQHALTVTSAPAAGGSVNPAGGTYPHGTVVTLTVTPNAGYQFSGWSGDCSGTNACNVTMNAAKSVTANFTLRQYALTVTSAPAAGGSVNPAGGTYSHGTVVTVTATPNAGYQFSGWSGACSSINADTSACNVTMNAAKSVTANFTLLQYPLTVTSSPATGGSIAPRGGMYPHGSIVSLTATPHAGYKFSGWSGGCSGTGVCNVTMNGAKSCTATFTGAPTTCDDKIKDLQKKVAANKVAADNHPGKHDYQLKAALRLYSAAKDELAKARATVGEKDKRYVRALKAFHRGKAALCAGHYRHAHHELWESYALAHEILKHSRHRHPNRR